MRVEPRPAPWWKRLALAAVLIATALPLTACHETTAFLFCLASSGAASPECQSETLAPGPPAAPTGLSATARTSDVRLRWARNVEPDLFAYQYYRSQTPGGPYELVGGFSFDRVDDGDPDVLIHAVGCRRLYYVVTALDKLRQESVYSAEASAATTCEGPPDTPSGLRAFGYPTSVLLVWSPNHDADLAGYDVYRYRPEVGSAERLNSQPLTAPEFHATGLTPLTDYFFQVRAVDTSGQASEPAEVGPVKTVEASGVAPTAPTGLRVQRHVADGALAWLDNPEPDVVGYHVYRAERADGPFELAFAELVRISFRWVELAAPGWFRVTAVNSGGQESEPSEAVFATPSPAAPTGLTATAGDGEVSLRWDENIEPDLDGYDVYAGAAATGPFEKVNALPVQLTSFRHTGLVNGVEVFYRVFAVDDDENESDPSTTVSATPHAAQQPPAAPTGLTATPGDHLVALDWADNTEADLAGYDVEMAAAATGPFNSVLRNPVTVSQRTVVDLPLSPWYFRVVAIDTTGGRSAPSAVVSATPCPAICPGPALPSLLRPAAASAGPASFPFELTVSGELDGGGSSRVGGGSIVGTGFGFTGTFVLDRALKGLDPELKELARAGLGGSWHAVLDWRLTPAAGGTMSGIALATFSDPRVGEACLRFEDTSTVKRRGTTRRVVTNGAFAFLGGTAEAGKLLGGGSYRVEPRPDGSLLYSGQGRPATGGAPLPAECAALAAS